MTPEPTNEERQAAALKIARQVVPERNGNVAVECHGIRLASAKAGYRAVAVETQVALTRTEARNAVLEAQVEEAREIQKNLCELLSESLWLLQKADGCGFGRTLEKELPGHGDEWKGRFLSVNSNGIAYLRTLEATK